MSELKVNTIQPATGSQVTVQAQVLGVPGTDPNHFATVSQLGGAGAGGISRAEAQELVDSGVAAANRHSDEQDELQTTQFDANIAIINENINTAKQEAITNSNAYTDSRVTLGIQGNSLGINQTWRNTPTGEDPELSGNGTLTRAVNTVYTNNTGKPIMVCVTCGSGQRCDPIFVDTILVGRIVSDQDDLSSAVPFTFIVPNGSTYKVGNAGDTFQYWAELR